MSSPASKRDGIVISCCLTFIFMVWSDMLSCPAVRVLFFDTSGLAPLLIVDDSLYAHKEEFFLSRLKRCLKMPLE